MSFVALVAGLLKLVLSALMSVLVVFVTYRVFIGANTDFNEDAEIRKGNVAVGILVTALLLGSANIIQQALSPVMNMLVLQFNAPASAQAVPAWELAAYGLGHLAMAFILAVLSMSFALRVFGRLTRGYMKAGKELEKGNVAVGLILAGVVFIVGMYIGEGVNSLSKSLIPQPSFGQVQIMR